MQPNGVLIVIQTGSISMSTVSACVVVLGGERAYDYLASLFVWFNIMRSAAKLAKKIPFFFWAKHNSFEI